MAQSNLYIGADMTVTYSGARKASDGTYLNAATVTYALKNEAGTTIGSGSLAYVAASNGNYTNTIESTVTVLAAEAGRYFLEVTLVEGAFNDFRRIRLVAVYRRAGD